MAEIEKIVDATARFDGLYELRAGILGGKVCFMADDGQFTAHKEIIDESWTPCADYDDEGKIRKGYWNIDVSYQEVDCPRFNKCSNCPQILGAVSLKNS